MALFRCCNLSRFVKFSHGIFQHATANSHNYHNHSSHLSAWFASTKKKCFLWHFHFCSWGPQIAWNSICATDIHRAGCLWLSRCILGYGNPWLALSTASTHPCQKEWNACREKKTYVRSLHTVICLSYLSLILLDTSLSLCHSLSISVNEHFEKITF